MPQRTNVYVTDVPSDGRVAPEGWNAYLPKYMDGTSANFAPMYKRAHNTVPVRRIA